MLECKVCWQIQQADSLRSEVVWLAVDGSERQSKSSFSFPLRVCVKRKLYQSKMMKVIVALDEIGRKVGKRQELTFVIGFALNFPALFPGSVFCSSA